ncbi:hypothetical protein ACJX0J_004521 (mitochondrion) [Zea mays]
MSEIDLILSLAYLTKERIALFLSFNYTDMGTGVEARELASVFGTGMQRKKKKIYILILFLGGILRIGKRCGFLCSDSKRRAKHIPVGPSSFFHEGQSEEDGLKPMAFLYSKSITKRRLGSSCWVVFSHGVGSQAIEKLLFFPLSRTSSGWLKKKAYDEHLLDGNALQSSALLTGLFGERRKRRSLAEEDKTICF